MPPRKATQGRKPHQGKFHQEKFPRNKTILKLELEKAQTIGNL